MLQNLYFVSAKCKFGLWIIFDLKSIIKAISTFNICVLGTSWKGSWAIQLFQLSEICYRIIKEIKKNPFLILKSFKFIFHFKAFSAVLVYPISLGIKVSLGFGKKYNIECFASYHICIDSLFTWKYCWSFKNFQFLFQIWTFDKTFIDEVFFSQSFVVVAFISEMLKDFERTWMLWIRYEW